MDPEDTSMNVSPLDVRQQRFRTKLRGFDMVEVTAFLTAVAEDYEQTLWENDRLRRDLSTLETLLNEHREHEKNLRDTLVTAQRVSGDIKEQAHQEGRRVVREAEGKADLVLQ